MVDSRDQLFLRLCVRNGIFTEPEANELLTYYRDSAGVKEGVGHFLVREGYLENDVADKLRHAIAKRADGHVVDSRKKVPSLNKTGGARAARGTGAERRRHVPARRTVAADPMQLTLIGIGMVVAIVAVIWMVWEMNAGSSTDEVVKSQEAEKASREARWEEEEATRKADAARSALATAQPENISYSASQIDEFEDRAKNIRQTAREASVDRGPRRGLEILDNGVKALEADAVPAEQVRILTDAREGILALLDTKFKDLQSKLAKAKESGDSAQIEEILEQIKIECGDEFHARATKG